MNKKWMPITAGVISIIVGIFLLPFTIFYFFMTKLEAGLSAIEYLKITVLALFAFLAIAGSIYNILWTKWRLAMVGSVAVSIILYLVGVFFVLPGIAAVVITVVSKNEFEK